MAKISWQPWYTKRFAYICVISLIHPASKGNTQSSLCFKQDNEKTCWYDTVMSFLFMKNLFNRKLCRQLYSQYISWLVDQSLIGAAFTVRMYVLSNYPRKGHRIVDYLPSINDCVVAQYSGVCFSDGNSFGWCTYNWCFQLLCFIATSSNWWADSLSSPVSAFGGRVPCQISNYLKRIYRTPCSLTACMMLVSKY